MEQIAGGFGMKRVGMLTFYGT